MTKAHEINHALDILPFVTHGKNNCFTFPPPPTDRIAIEAR